MKPWFPQDRKQQRVLCKDLLTSTSRTLLQKQATYHHVVCLCSGSTVGETLERSGSGEHGPEVKVSVLIAVSVFFHPSSCYIHLERMACRCLKWPGSTVCVCVWCWKKSVSLFKRSLSLRLSPHVEVHHVNAFSQSPWVSVGRGPLTLTSCLHSPAWIFIWAHAEDRPQSVLRSRLRPEKLKRVLDKTSVLSHLKLAENRNFCQLALWSCLSIKEKRRPGLEFILQLLIAIQKNQDSLPSF